MNNLYILSGPVQTGKSTRLKKWVADKSSADGILQIVKDNKRYLFDIRSKLERLLSVNETDDQSNIINVGNFAFNKRTFEWARAELLNSLENRPEWLIVDEVGKLELIGEGLEPAVYDLMLKAKDYPTTKFLFIVRDSLLQSFFEYYNLNKENVAFFEFPGE